MKFMRFVSDDNQIIFLRPDAVVGMYGYSENNRDITNITTSNGNFNVAMHVEKVASLIEIERSKYAADLMMERCIHGGR